MSASVLPGDAIPEQQPDAAVRPLRVVVLIAEPARAERVRSALALHPGLVVLADPTEPADIVVTDAEPLALRRPTEGVGTRKLTPREREVLELLADGASNKMIARRLGISVATAKFHVAALLGKLGARGRSDAVAIGVRLGLLML
jgi:DNA-binding CsgD family transcriptional regulator